MEPENFLRAGQFETADAGTPQDVASREEIDAANLSLQVDEANQQITNQPRNFAINVPDTVSSQAIGNSLTLNDVRQERDRLETEQVDIEDTTVPDFEPSIFNDPQRFIESALFGDDEPTALEEEAAGIRSGITETTEGIEESLSAATQRAEKTTGIGVLQQQLAETNSQIAQRKTRFRRELRAFEQSAQERGVARAFFEDEKNKIQADATAELADLYIIQNAQSGNVEAAKSYIDTAVNNRYRFIESELAARRAKLAEIEPRLAGEKLKENQKLQIALNERASLIEEQKSNDKMKRELAAEVAAQGAPSTLINEIVNSKDPNAALALATPYIGRYERMKVQSSLAAASLSRRKALVDLALAGDESAFTQLGAFGETLKQKLADAKTQEERVAQEQITRNSFSLAENSQIARRISENPAFGAVTGVEKNNPYAKIGGGFAAGGAAGAVGGSVLPVIGTALGGVTGAISGAATGFLNYKQTKLQQEDFFDDVEALTSRATLQTLIDAKEAGATFGALSNQELGLLIQASNTLTSKAVIDPVSGQVTGITGTPDQVRRAINEVVELYERAELENFGNAFNQSEIAQLDAL